MWNTKYTVWTAMPAASPIWAIVVPVYPCSQKSVYAALTIRHCVALARSRRDTFVGSDVLTPEQRGGSGRRWSRC